MTHNNWYGQSYLKYIKSVKFAYIIIFSLTTQWLVALFIMIYVFYASVVPEEVAPSQQQLQPLRDYKQQFHLNITLTLQSYLCVVT